MIDNDNHHDERSLRSEQRGGHHHHNHDGPIGLGPIARRAVIGLLTAVGVLTAIAAIVLWPGKSSVDIPLPLQNGQGGAVHTEAGTVTRQSVGACGSPSAGRVLSGTPETPTVTSYVCTRNEVLIESGRDKGKTTLLEIPSGPDQPKLVTGDDIRLVRQSDGMGTTLYGFNDYARGLPLTIVVALFALTVVAVARWRGLRALAGLVLAFGIVIMFLLPALLDDKPALPTALTAASMILFTALYLAHGVSWRTSAALLGTLSSMLVAAVLSLVVLRMTHITGLSEEQNSSVATYLGHVSIPGLLLAGFIIGSLGVLNDVTITQAATAFEMAALDKAASRRKLFAASMRVGRDHIASTVYTLVFAYAGGALPALLLLSVAGRDTSDVLTGDAIAIELARAAVGGIALTLSVPLTTTIAVWLARPWGSVNTTPTPPPTPHRRPAPQFRRPPPR